MRRDQIGIQLYTVREHTAKDMLGTLRRVADIGYEAVEFAGYGDVAPAEIRTVLDDTGMVAIGSHVPFDDWEDRRGQVFEDLHTLGCTYAVVPSVPTRRRGDLDMVVGLAETFNHWASETREQGLRFAYHNHDYEFAPLGQGTVWDTLVAASDPDLVELEVDVYWARYAGVDPVELIQRHAQRVPLLHAKDMAAGDDRNDAPVGTGVLPWEQLVATADAAGAHWYIVEQDEPKNAFDDVRLSLHNLRRWSEGASEPKSSRQ
jgi:sugar phosphate isomerase/epimerase